MKRTANHCGLADDLNIKQCFDRSAVRLCIDRNALLKRLHEPAQKPLAFGAGHPLPPKEQPLFLPFFEHEGAGFLRKTKIFPQRGVIPLPPDGSPLPQDGDGRALLCRKANAIVQRRPLIHAVEQCDAAGLVYHGLCGGFVGLCDVQAHAPRMHALVGIAVPLVRVGEHAHVVLPAVQRKFLPGVMQNRFRIIHLD